VVWGVFLILAYNRKGCQTGLLLLLLVWHAPLGVRSAKRRHQSPEWTILSHSYRLIQWEIVWSQLLLDSLHPRSSRTSWWFPPVLRRGSSYDTPGICLVWHSCLLGLGLFNFIGLLYPDQLCPQVRFRYSKPERKRHLLILLPMLPPRREKYCRSVRWIMCNARQHSNIDAFQARGVTWRIKLKQ